MDPRLAMLPECNFDHTCIVHELQPLRYFCTQCFVPFCKKCENLHHNDHPKIQVVKYNNRFGVKLEDIENFLPTDEISKYKNDSLVYLNPPPRVQRCAVCGEPTQSRFCSLACKMADLRRIEDSKRKVKTLSLFPDAESSHKKSRRDDKDDQDRTRDFFVM